MLAGARRFFGELFEDIDGSYSMKRTGFALVLILLTLLVLSHVFLAVAVASDLINGLVELIKWLGGFIASEQVARKVSDTIAERAAQPAQSPIVVNQVAAPAAAPSNPEQ